MDIREGINKIIWGLTAGGIQPSEALPMLDALGVVLKVDAEWPANPYRRKPRGEGFDLGYDVNLDTAFYFGQRSLIDAGYTLTEEL